MNKIQQQFSSSANITAKTQITSRVEPDPKNGIAGYTKVNAAGFSLVEISQRENRSGAYVTLTRPSSGVYGEDFGKEGFLTLFLDPGTWSYQTSPDGINYHEVTKLAVKIVNEEPNPQINLTLDGSKFPATYSRYTKVS